MSLDREALCFSERSFSFGERGRCTLLPAAGGGTKVRGDTGDAVLALRALFAVTELANVEKPDERPKVTLPRRALFGAPEFSLEEDADVGVVVVGAGAKDEAKKSRLPSDARGTVTAGRGGGATANRRVFSWRYEGVAVGGTGTAGRGSSGGESVSGAGRCRARGRGRALFPMSRADTSKGETAKASRTPGAYPDCVRCIPRE